MRNELRQVIAHDGEAPVVEVPWSKRVVEYLKGMQDYEVQRNTERALAEMQAAPAQSLPEQLRELIGHQEAAEVLPLNGQVLLDHAAAHLDASAAVSVAEVIRKQLNNNS